MGISGLLWSNISLLTNDKPEPTQNNPIFKNRHLQDEYGTDREFL